MSEIWLRTDEKADVIASLRLVFSSCGHANTDITAWKWVVVGTHSALQGAMALHLGFGNGLLVAKQQDVEAWLAAHENGTPYPAMMMDGFLDLYEKIKRDQILGHKFVPNGSQGRSVKKLNKFRNEFIHFMPKGWSIELSGMPLICLDCLDIVADLDQHSLCTRWEDDAQKSTFRGVLEECRVQLRKLKDEYTR